MNIFKDSRGRQVTYLRVSLTDRCNFRCFYCVPVQEFSPMKRSELLTLEEIERVCRILADSGIKKVRFTGGEPLLRAGALELMRRVANIPGIREVVLTTNGAFLRDVARELAECGVRRVNVSLDSLKRGVFTRITGVDALEDVIRGIDEAVKTGLRVKLNTVILRGINHEEAVDLLKFAEERGIYLRFVEYMPIGRRFQELFMGENELIGFLKTRIKVAFMRREGIENVYSSSDPPCEFGVIPAHSGGFCSDCNRIRLTSDGKIRFCLYSPLGFNVKKLLREGAGDAEIAEGIKRALLFKPSAGAGQMRYLYAGEMKSIGG